MTSFTFDAVLAHEDAEWSSAIRTGALRPEVPANDAWLLLEASGEFAVQADAAGRIRHATEASARLLDYPYEYLLRSAVHELVSVEHRERLARLLARCVARDEPGRERVRFASGVGGSRWLDLRVAPCRSPAGEPGVLLFGSDISDWLESEQRLTEQTFRDGLTGLGNRTYIRKRITEYLAGRKDGKRFAVALMDLDGFKRVNDSLGHEFGDGLLKEVAVRLQSAVRASNMVARLGGDEFVLLFDDLDSDESAVTALERVVNLCRQPLRISGYEVRVTTSIGLAFAGDAHQTESHLLKHADLAMYEAKAQGKNQYCVFSPELALRFDEQFRIEQRMFVAVQHGEFMLHYQPIVTAGSAKVCAVEALMRWEHAEGAIPPDVFIPVAENNGLINYLGAWALRCACAQIAAWDEQGIQVGYISVNVSPVQFRHPGFVESVTTAIRDAGISAQRLVLEITEGVLMTDPKATEDLLIELRQLGIRFAVDDFGTGYSSLAYLRRFPLSALKIDRSFVSDMVTSPHARTIVSAVLSLARELGLVAIAEGVETDSQGELLAMQGCELLQGWRYSKALSAAQFERAVGEGKLALGETTVFAS